MTRQYDVVVCGGGGAGMAAAIAAADAGASVAILEKAGEVGGSTAVSGGAIATVRDPEQAIQHYHELTQGRTPRAVIEAHVRGLQELPGWIEANGFGTDEQPLGAPVFPPRHAGSAFPDLPGAEGIGERIKVAGDAHGGTSLTRFLKTCVADRDIDVFVSMGARELLTDDSGRVIGAAAGGGDVFRAAGGVVLATGGFAWDQDLVRDYFGAELPSFAPPHRNAGDGLRMAQSVGAALWHMNALATGVGFVTPGHEAAWMCLLAVPGFFIVDGTGSRYMNELEMEAHASGSVMLQRNMTTGQHDRLPSYLVFDETSRAAGPIVSTALGANRVLQWSPDNEVELDHGWIQAGETPEELAAKLGVDPDRLATEVREFNEAARGGSDRFGRSGEGLAELRAPFYGIALWPTLINTQGGPRRDERARVIGATGQPIPGLFSAGELGSQWAQLYPGAGNVTEALVFGRIAGAEAAAMAGKAAPAPKVAVPS